MRTSEQSIDRSNQLAFKLRGARLVSIDALTSLYASTPYCGGLGGSRWTRRLGWCGFSVWGEGGCVASGVGYGGGGSGGGGAGGEARQGGFPPPSYGKGRRRFHLAFLRGYSYYY